MDRQEIHRTMAAEYESRWNAGDPWAGVGAETEHATRKNSLQREFLAGRRYQRTIEVGCGNGNLTPILAEFSDSVCSLDIAPSALARAREACGPLPGQSAESDRVHRTIRPDLEGGLLPRRRPHCCNRCRWSRAALGRRVRPPCFRPPRPSRCDVGSRLLKRRPRAGNRLLGRHSPPLGRADGSAGGRP